MTPEADSKTGAYPNADQPNQFGTFYRDFFLAWKAKAPIEPDFYGAYGIAMANSDDEFRQVSEAIDWDELDPKSMVAVMHSAWALTVRLNWWSYRQAPEMAVRIK